MQVRAMLFYYALLRALAGFTAWEISSAKAQDKAGISMLFIGNSYTARNQLGRVIAEIAASAPIPLKIHYEIAASEGATLNRHLEDQILLKKIKSQSWDYVVLQEQSLRPIVEPQKMLKAAKLLSGEIQHMKSRLLFFLTWPRSYDLGSMKGLSHTYMLAAQQNQGLVAPVGLAWVRSLRTRPELELYDLDGSHANTRGSYLTACVFYATLTGNTPEGATCSYPDLSPEETTFLQKMAWETVRQQKRAGHLDFSTEKEPL